MGTLLVLTLGRGLGQHKEPNSRKEQLRRIVIVKLGVMNLLQADKLKWRVMLTQAPLLSVRVRDGRIIPRMLIMPLCPLGANMLMKNCVSTMEVLPNRSEGTAADLHSHQLVVDPVTKSIFI